MQKAQQHFADCVNLCYILDLHMKKKAISLYVLKMTSYNLRKGSPDQKSIAY